MNKKKYIFLFLLIIILCLSCKKHKLDSSLNTGIEIKNTMTHNNIKTLQEIIQEYPSTLPENKRDKIIYEFQDKIIYEFQIEGNFTGSGNIEILAFYRNNNRTYQGLDLSFCFILNSTGDNIEKIFPLEWDAILPAYKNDKEISFYEALGRPIIWKDWLVGYVGDFNKNDKEELCLFGIYGIGKWPDFFEFDGEKFARIINLTPGPKDVIVTAINSEERIISLKETIPTDETAFEKLEKNISYIWNEISQIYEILLYDTKIIRRNLDLQQYVEIKTE